MEHLELPRHHGARASGGAGRTHRKLADAAVQVRWNWHDAYDDARSSEWSTVVDRGLVMQGQKSRDAT